MNGAVVVDVNLSVSWVVQEVQSPPARALLAGWLAADVARLAPALFAAEAASAVLRCARRGAIDPGQTERYLAAMLASVTVIPDDALLAPRALTIAQQLGFGKAYDCLSAALAEREGCELWTGDTRFFHAAQPTFPWIHVVGEAMS